MYTSTLKSHTSHKWTKLFCISKTPSWLGVGSESHGRQDSFVFANKRNDMSTTFLQQILSDKLLLIVIVEAKK